MKRTRILNTGAVAFGVAVFTLAGWAGCGKSAAEKDTVKKEPTKEAAAADQAPYYAVALTSGSLFFGHIEKQDDRYLHLNDIFYFQRTPPSPEAAKKGEGPGLVLAPQSEDMYGPTDELIVNREHVIYYQELRPDSKVVDGIVRTKEALAQRATLPQQAPQGQPQQPGLLQGAPAAQGQAPIMAPARAPKKIQ